MGGSEMASSPKAPGQAVAATLAATAFAALGWILGCSADRVHSPRPVILDTLPTGMAVSAPVPPPLLSAAESSAPMASSLGGGTVVYVSIAPGTVPHGSTLSIEDKNGIGLFKGVLTDGGMDPVPVNGTVGDTLRIVTTDSLGARAITFAAVAAHPPVKVVRTVPPRGRTDVPLNALLAGVFSDPLASGTVTAQSVELLKGGQSVAGAPTLAPDGFELSFQPANALAPLTQYELVITTAVTNTLGDHLSQETRVAFTTGSQPGALASLTVSPSSAIILQGGMLQLIAETKDAAGNIIAPPGTVSWALDTGLVLTVSQTGLLTSTGGISVDGVTATVAGFSARAYPIRVVPPTSVRIAGTWDWTERIDDLSGTICADTGVVVFSQVGGGFTGTAQQVGSCTGPSGTVSNSGPYQVTYGSVGGGPNPDSPGSVTFGFLSKGCYYTASFIGTAPTALSGTFTTCGGSSAAGTWKAVRRP
jgi:Bacterial Ig-like domain